MARGRKPALYRINRVSMTAQQWADVLNCSLSTFYAKYRRYEQGEIRGDQMPCTQPRGRPRKR